MKNFSFDTKIIKPYSEKKPQSAIILFHGYGGDGNDISVLANYWKRFLPNTIFLCPNAPEICSVNPSGFQWFDLTHDKKEYILKESGLVEEKINSFIDEVKEVYKIKEEKICLTGFSQGCMIILNIALKSFKEFNCIIGFSGKIINQEDLINKINSKQKIFLFHGDKDNIVPLSNLLEAKEFFSRINYKIRTKILKNCEHHIPIEASSLALKYIKKNLYD